MHACGVTEMAVAALMRQCRAVQRLKRSDVLKEPLGLMNIINGIEVGVLADVQCNEH